MSRKTKRLAALGTALLLLLAGVLIYLHFKPVAGNTVGENLIRNGQFAQVSDGMPVSWYTDAYIYQGYTDFDVQNGEAHIVNHYPNDARFAQDVEVVPDSFYCLRGLIRADAKGGLGANLSVADVYAFSDPVYDTDGEWQEVTLYGRTGESQKHLTVFARLGGYSGEAEGEAWFRDVTLCRVDAIPDGAICVPLYAQQVQQQAAPKNWDMAGGWTLALCSVLYIAAFLLLIVFLRRPKGLPAIPRVRRSGLVYLTIVLLLGLILRLFIALRVPGYDVDIGCFTAWADIIARVGPARFYEQGFCDYPPGYLMVLWPLGMLGRLTGGTAAWMVKLPAIVSDLVLCVLMYREGRKRADERTALAAVMFYALNPMVLCAGAAWGQSDGVMTLLVMLTLLFALKGSWRCALPVYMLSVLVKPQALLFGPLGLAALVMHLRKTWRDPAQKRAALRDAGLGALLTALTALAVILPFKGSKPFGWLFSLYAETMSEYAYATVNACNLFFILGRNWSAVEGRAPGALATVFAIVLCVLPALNVYRAQIIDAFRVKTVKKAKRYSRQDRMGLALTAALCALTVLVPLVFKMAGLYTYQVLNWTVIGFAVAVAAVHLFLSGDVKNLPLLGAGMLMVIFTCGSMMHERYLFPVAALLLLSYQIKRDKRILTLALVVSLAGFLNIGAVLDRNIRISGVEAHLSAPEYGLESDLKALEYLSAALTCVAQMGALYLSLHLSRESAKPRLLTKEDTSGLHRAAQPPAFPLPVDEPIPRLKRADVLIMLGVTSLYAVLALSNLGSMKAPQTAFVSKDAGESVVIDLGAEHDFTLYFYGGIHDFDQTFSVAVSEDGAVWQDPLTRDMLIGDCFKWQRLENYSTVPQHGRYVRLTADHNRLTLFETLFKDAATGEPIRASILSDDRDNPTAQMLVDEPDTMEGGEPSWYNSMYFDEIYHARTAYEHLHGMRPYETTHPPLGKVLMSFAVSLFGMTPFGWRFAGAVAGVLMLPGMYLLGMLLIRRRWGGPAAMLLMALDCMHFTQTRIATIDSFVVLFIIWAVYFMLRWFRQDLFGKPFLKTLVPLGLSGVFMGLSIASKWTGCYNGLGLAVLFFWGIIRRARQIGAARATPENERTPSQRAAVQSGKKRLILTVASCSLFFILVPLTIYYVSYIPYFRYNGGVTVRKVIEAAVGPYFTDGYVGGMLGYHSTPGLGMDHPYYSPWYEWPVIAKPMWYFSILFRDGLGEMSIMAFGNPVVWWTGLAGVFGTLYFFVRRHIHTVNGLSATLTSVWKDDPRYGQMLLCFLAQYLPWMLVPRGTYIYHYFPSVPFIILCALLCLDRLANRHPKQVRVAVGVLLGAALVCFVALFPYASGMRTPTEWMRVVKDIFPIPLHY